MFWRDFHREGIPIKDEVGPLGMDDVQEAVLIHPFLSHEQFIFSESVTVVSAKKRTKALVKYSLIHISFINSVWLSPTLIPYSKPGEPEVPCFSVHLRTNTNIFSFHNVICSPQIWTQSEALSGLDKIYFPWSFRIQFSASKTGDWPQGHEWSWYKERDAFSLDRGRLLFGPTQSREGKSQRPTTLMLPMAHFIQWSIASSFPLLLCRFPFNLAGSEYLSWERLMKASKNMEKEYLGGSVDEASDSWFRLRPWSQGVG